MWTVQRSKYTICTNCSVVSAVLIGIALHLTNGELAPVPLILVNCAFIALLMGISDFRFLGRPLRSAAATNKLLIFGICAQVLFQFLHNPGRHVVASTRVVFDICMMTATYVFITTIFFRCESIKIVSGLLISLYLACAMWVLTHSPNPDIDVWMMHKESIEALMNGVNPYGITFKNPYPHEKFYGPGLVREGTLLFGYPYPPINLLYATLFDWLSGDFRIGLAVASACAAAFCLMLRPDKIGLSVALLLLFTPRAFYVVEQGWTEPLFLLLGALTVYADTKRSPWLPLCLGLMFSAKQNSIVLAPLLPFLQTYRELAPAALLGPYFKTFLVILCINLPFLILNPNGFLRSVVFLQSRLSFRVDSLNLSAWSVSNGLNLPITLLFLLSLAFMYTLVFQPAVRKQLSFPLACTLVFFSTLLFYRAAFCNYYWLLIGLLCLSVVVSPTKNEPWLNEQ